MPAPGNPAVTSIVIDCNDPEPLVTFWTDLLGIGVTSRFEGFVWLETVPGGGPSIAFQRVPEPKSGKNRLHLDLLVDDTDAMMERIAGLGGSRVADHAIGGFRWTVVADPAGNEFCIAARVQEG